MLSIISDIHLTDGSSGETINYKAFDIYKNNLKQLIEKIHSKKNFYPKLTIVLLGDILDLIRSETWLKKNIRPWDDYNENAYLESLNDIVDKIIANNKKTIDVFNELKNNLIINGQKIEVDIFYMVGNHDWMFYIKDEKYNKIRQKICDAFHLTNPYNKPFPFNINENDVLNNTMKKHNVFARHGDLYDNYNFSKKRNNSSLGDAVVIDIITKFAYDLKNKNIIKDKELYKNFINGLKELDNVKPAYHMKIWLDNLINNCFTDKEIKKQLYYEWKICIRNFFKSPYVKRQNNIFNPFDTVGLLKIAFNNSKLVGYLSKWFSIDLPNWVNAANEDAKKQKTSKFIVYGHTHSYKVEPLSSVVTDNESFNQFYINTGTWRPIHKLNKADIIKNSFSSFKMMTFTIFYLKEENNNDFEVWTGYLA